MRYIKSNIKIFQSDKTTFNSGFWLYLGVIFKWKNMSQNILYGIDGIDDVFTDLENEGTDA